MQQAVSKAIGAFVKITLAGAIALFAYLSCSSGYGKEAIDRANAHNVDLGGAIKLEMNREQVRSVAGEPREIATAGERGVMRELWRYEKRSVTFTNGYVTDVTVDPVP